MVSEGSGRRLPVSVPLLMEAWCNSILTGVESRKSSAGTGVPGRMGPAEIPLASGCRQVRAVGAGDMSRGRGWVRPRVITSLDAILMRLRPRRVFGMVPAWPSLSQLVLV